MTFFQGKTVVVPMDFSDASVEALDTALQIADQPQRVHVIHVLPVLAATEPGVIWDTLDDVTRREHAEQAMRERFSDDRYRGIQFAVAFGDPGREITEHAERIKADLIVLPSHGRTGISRLLIGSVAERVCRLSHCPVLVLRQ